MYIDCSALCSIKNIQNLIATHGKNMKKLSDVFGFEDFVVELLVTNTLIYETEFKFLKPNQYSNVNLSRLKGNYAVINGSTTISEWRFCRYVFPKKVESSILTKLEKETHAKNNQRDRENLQRREPSTVKKYSSYKNSFVCSRRSWTNSDRNEVNDKAQVEMIVQTYVAKRAVFGMVLTNDEGFKRKIDDYMDQYDLWCLSSNCNVNDEYTKIIEFYRLEAGEVEESIAKLIVQ
jgi:hypothetical protein